MTKRREDGAHAYTEIEEVDRQKQNNDHEKARERGDRTKR